MPDANVRRTPPCGDSCAALRRAFMETWKDPELLAEAWKMTLEVGPISGEDLQAMLARIHASPPEVLRKTREAIRLKR